MSSDYSGWLLVSDIDGTLNNKKRQLPENNRKAVKDYVEKGGIFTLCSGRNLASLTPHYLKLGIETPALFLNGAGIYDFKTKRILSFQPFSSEAEDILIKTAKKHKTVDLTMFSPDTLYLAQFRTFGLIAAKLDRLNFVVSHGAEKLDRGNIGKATFFGAPSLLRKIKEELLNNSNNMFDCFMTSSVSLEVVVNGVNKGSGVRRLAGILGIDMNNTAAVGDYYNDEKMLKAVAHPVCCEQAPDDIKKISEYVACHCNDGAVADFINYIETKYIR